MAYSQINDTILLAEEFCDAILQCYGLTLPGLPDRCDGCGNAFSLRHGYSCTIGGNVIRKHNEPRDELADIAARAFSPGAVRSEPKIFLSCGSAKSTSDSQERGDVLVRGLFTPGKDGIIDVCIPDVDAKTYQGKTPAKVLEGHEKRKMAWYKAACQEQHRDFAPFVASHDGLLAYQAKVLLQLLARRLAQKWDKPYSVVANYVRARMSIAILRASHSCLRGSRIPAHHMSTRRPMWEDQAGLSLFSYF